jgi:hypothetical protein
MRGFVRGAGAVRTHFGDFIMNSWGTRYWRVFNILVRDLGLTALLSGAGFTVWGTMRMLEREFITIEGAVSIAILPVGLLVAAIGWAILRAPTYRPDLGDKLWGFDPLGAEARQSSPPKRSWWTGEPI